MNSQPPIPERIKFRPRENRRDRPVETKARVIVRQLVERGMPVNARKLERLHGISHVMIEQAMAAERARLEALEELQVDPTALKPTAQAKVEVAKRAAIRDALAEVNKRLAYIDEEVRRRVLAESKEHLEYLAQERAEASKTEALYRDLIGNHKPTLTIDEFRLILSCLHDDSRNSTSGAKLAEAFRTFNAKKLQLTGQK